MVTIDNLYQPTSSDIFPQRFIRFGSRADRITAQPKFQAGEARRDAAEALAQPHGMGNS